VAGQVKLDMRNVGQLVGRDAAIDDRGPVDCEGFGPPLLLCALIDSSAGRALD
jgi:hypothetical protein